MEVFDTLPLLVVLNENLLCVHGGISPDLKECEDARTVDRFGEPPDHGLMIDLMWSDPTDKLEGWALNTRGSGYLFGEKAITEFMHANSIELVIRSH